MSIRAVRDDKTAQPTAQAVQCGSDGQYKLGAWIATTAGSAPSPSASPATGRFGALGHGINDGHRPAHAPPVRLHHVFGGHRCEEGGKEPRRAHGAFR